MLQINAIAAGAAVAGVLGIAATRPNVFRVQRAATISAPPDTVYPLIADFRRWADWSPWEKLEPGMTRSYGGADSGTGATYGQAYVPGTAWPRVSIMMSPGSRMGLVAGRS